MGLGDSGDGKTSRGAGSRVTVFLPHFPRGVGISQNNTDITKADERL